jgi:phosphatidylglycerophosphate synthase
MSNGNGVEKPNFRLLADMVTDARPWGVAYVCSEIVRKRPDFRSYKLAGKLSLALATDAVDGAFARYSNIPSVEGARKDQVYDKLAYTMLMFSFAYATDDMRYLKYEAVNSARNFWTEHRREQLRIKDLSADARGWGKAKMATQTTGLILDASPVGDKHPEMVHDIHAIATGLSVISGIDIELDARRKLATADRRGHEVTFGKQYETTFTQLRQTLDDALAS